MADSSLAASPAGVVLDDDEARASARRRVLRGVLAGLVVAAGALVAHRVVVAGRVEWTNDAFVDGRVASVGARVAGHVLSVEIEENVRVKQGDVLVRLDPADFAARASMARADLDVARNRMLAAQAAVAVAEAEGLAAAAERDRAAREAARIEALHAKGAASRQALDAALSARDATQARVRALASRAEAERAVLGNDAPVRQAEAALQAAELALSYTTIVAPVDGVVGRKNVETGSWVVPGQPLLAITEDGESWVTANFKETQIGAMRQGAPVEIHVDAYPDVVWRGHVESVAPATGATFALLPPDNATGNFTKVVQRVPVRIALDGPEPEEGVAPPPALPVGLSAEVEVRVR